MLMGKEVRIETLDTYTSVLVALSVALLLVASGFTKKQLVWRRPRYAFIRRRQPRR
jgi:hypothetical protein